MVLDASVVQVKAFTPVPMHASIATARPNMHRNLVPAAKLFVMVTNLINIWIKSLSSVSHTKKET